MLGLPIKPSKDANLELAHASFPKEVERNPSNLIAMFAQE
jgi:hypothetical protein